MILAVRVSLQIVLEALQLEETAVPSSCRSYSPDLRHTSLAMGVTVLLERPKAWSGPPDTCGHYTAKPLEGETTMG